MNKDIKKYSLVVEPHGSYEKYVVCFEFDLESETYKFEKKPFKSCAEIAKSQKEKSSLFELDVFTSTMFQDDYDLFKKLGLYQNVHNVYIQFTDSRGYLKRLPVIYDEDLVVDKLDKVRNGKVIDENQIEEYIEMLIENSDFYRKYMRLDIYKTNTVASLAAEVRKTGVYVNQSGGSDESRYWLFINKQQLETELSKYHIFRGFVLAEAQMIEEKRKNAELNCSEPNKEESKVTVKKKVYPGYVSQEYKQIKLDGFGE